MLRRLKGTWAIVPALAACNCLSASMIGSLQPEFRHIYSLNPNGRVMIQNLYGDVRITAWDRDEVLVTAIKKSRDPRQANDASVVVDSSSDSLSIRTQYAGAEVEHPASVEYRIMVPRTANLQNVKLINGGLSISGLAGSIKASSVNGNIRADNLEGQVDLSTINGQLEAGFSRVSRANPINLTSVNGPIRLSLPSGADAELIAHNLSGGIDSEFGHARRASSGHRLRTVVNRGGTQIHLNNVNGGISIRSHARRFDRSFS